VSFDLDGLKRVNDSAGHRAGDEVLASFAALLAALCRAEDLPARLGGDEFSVLLPGDDLGGGRGLAERILAAVRSCDVLAQRGVTVSGGVAQWAPSELPDDFLRRADEALYAAKRDGGDAVALDS
jgi:diguanylate cyclase (GGDEF)-like protein